jgi:hypothetical protein
LPPQRKTGFRQSDVKRLLQAAKAAGIDIERFEVDLAAGKVTIFARGEGEPTTVSRLDAWIAADARPS